MHKNSYIAALLLALLGTLGPTEGAPAWTFKVIHSFCANGDCNESHNPSGLIEDSSGHLFGIAGQGTGDQVFGAVFELLPNSDRSKWHLRTLHKFCQGGTGCPDGAYPSDALIMDTAGNFYGAASDGGTGSGVIYELSPKGKYKTLYVLCPMGSPCNDGFDPSSLTFAGASQGLPYDGRSPLYGTTAGGAYEYGNVFTLERKKGAWRYTILHAFCSAEKCSDGQYPAGLTFDSAGSLYGIAALGGEYGHGVLFKLVPTSKRRWVESSVHDFCQLDDPSHCSDGGWPSTLSIASDGTLYGTAVYLGPKCQHLHNKHECGTLFQVHPDGTQYNVLYGFCTQQACVDGRAPIALQEVQPGNFAGATYLGGGSDLGTVFQLKDGSFQTLHEFCLKDCTDGKWPVSRLVVDPSGSIFGTTWYGGAYGYGEVFELSP